MDERKPIRGVEMDQLVDRLSPEGRALWLKTERMAEIPREERTPDHRNKLYELSVQSVQLPAEDQLIWEQLSALKKQALEARMKREAQERNDMRWMANRMQEEGLQRGLDKEQREKMTLGEFLDLDEEHR